MIDALGFRDYTDSDESDLLQLNESVVALTSPLDAKRLQQLRSQGCIITVATISDATVGMMMCFTDGSDYDSVNYRWFNERLRQFVYIDRVVVAEAHRGIGAGQSFYRHLKQKAAAAGHHWLAAEINSVPPNTGSLTFHRKQGFVEAGSQTSGAKTVSMQLFGLQ